MKSIKKTVAGMALVVAMGVTMSQPVWANVSEAEAALEATDLSYAFGETVQPTQVVALSEQEMKETEGAVFNFVIGGAVGVGIYAATNFYNNRPITWQGLAYSAGTGALTGGVGGALIRASGGGILGNVAWRPSMFATNYSFGQYRNYRGW